VLVLPKIVIGLGNPGVSYARTRHNLGFRVVDRVAEILGARFRRDEATPDVLTTAISGAGGHVAWLAKSRTFMNHSGRAASALCRRHDVDAGELLVVFDDADLALGRLRVRRGGGSGGHNGLRSITQALATADFARLKLGVRGAGRPAVDLADYVLAPFDEDELELVEGLVARGADAVVLALNEGLESAMNRLGGSVPEGGREGS
jgi:PTH1 family peptidyl-tRNA hydrolase